MLDKLARTIYLTVILGLLAVLPANAKCSDETYPMLLGQTVNVNRVLNGGECRDRVLRSADPIYGSNIVTQPKHGTLTSAGRMILVYRPKPGFVGQDSYSFQWVGKKDGTTPSAVTVNVTVAVR
jgi:hypothetical protein